MAKSPKHRAEPPQILTVIPHILLFVREDSRWAAAREAKGIWVEGETKEEALFKLVELHKSELGLDLTIIDKSDHQVVLRRTNTNNPLGNHFKGYSEIGGGRLPIWVDESLAQTLTLEHALGLAGELQHYKPRIEDLNDDSV